MAEKFRGTVTVAPSNSRIETVTINGNTGNLVLGGNNRDGDAALKDKQGNTRARLNGDGQRLELLSASGEIIAMIGGAGNIRAGSNGENGDLFLYRASATNIFANAQWSVRLSANDGRLEIRNSSGKLICMIGANGNLRLGSNGSDGDILLYPASADDIFNNGQATASIDATSGNLSLGGNNVNGAVVLRDRAGTVRARLLSASQRVEMLNRDGDIISMMGGDANVRVGTNGLSGNMFLYPSSATDIFNNGQASIALNGQTGDIVLRNADCAEEFPLAAGAHAMPGQVISLAQDACVKPSETAYDKRVVGIVAGAGDLQPGIVLGHDDEADGAAARVALMGRVYCWADAGNGPIDIGDPIVSSSVAGNAMKATDLQRAFGATIGKAIDPLTEGSGLIRVLVSLQ